MRPRRNSGLRSTVGISLRDSTRPASTTDSPAAPSHPGPEARCRWPSGRLGAGLGSSPQPDSIAPRPRPDREEQTVESFKTSSRSAPQGESRSFDSVTHPAIFLSGSTYGLEGLSLFTRGAVYLPDWADRTC